jgi:hypothetical protein
MSTAERDLVAGALDYLGKARGVDSASSSLTKM